MKVNNLRVSLTQRCNMKCIYCHHEGESVVTEEEISADEFERILRIAKDCGIEKLKLTGGEPLMRRDIVSLVCIAKRYMKDISMTTNGSLLPLYAERLKEAGLNRVNISLDSLRRERFRAITSGNLDKVVEGIRSARNAGIEPIKINTVVLRGVNDDEIWDIVDFSIENGCVLQLIELEATKEEEEKEFYAKYHCDLKAIEEEISERADRTEVRSMHHRKKYLFDGAEIEVVRPMHNTEFCANCTRLRVTSEGRLKPCLLCSDEIDMPEDESGARETFLRAIESKKPYWR